MVGVLVSSTASFIGDGFSCPTITDSDVVSSECSVRLLSTSKLARLACGFLPSEADFFVGAIINY